MLFLILLIINIKPYGIVFERSQLFFAVEGCDISVFYASPKLEAIEINVPRLDNISRKIVRFEAAINDFSDIWVELTT